MQYPYTSDFPQSIDDCTFICDISLKNKPSMEAYNNLIQSGKYTEANIFLANQQKIHFYSADFFNYIEAKIHSWQTVIKNKEKYNPFHFTGSDHEPVDIKVNEIWI